MKESSPSEHAVALVNLALDVLLCADRAPASPVNAHLPAQERRRLRRSAKRLRAGKALPRYTNLHTAAELADIYERTADRDEILELGAAAFREITLELGRVIEENGPEVGTAIEALVREVKQSAEEHGPGSEAWQRFRHLQFLDWMGRQTRSHQRRQRTPAPLRIPLAPDPTMEARLMLSASEILEAPPPGEAIVSIPPEGQDHGRGRILLRIGIGASSWIGSFACGHTEFTTSYMMPDGKHLFVAAEGAGYIIDARQRTLVEETGSEIVHMMRDEPMTMLIVNHGGRSLELFDRTGRLAREVPIECLRPPSE